MAAIQHLQALSPVGKASQTKIDDGEEHGRRWTEAAMETDLLS